MKKILLFLMTIMPFVLSAQKDFKLVEQSAKKRPDWCNNSSYTKGSFVIKAEKSPSIEEARNKVMNMLLKEIASSVAIKIESSTENSTNYSYKDGQANYETEVQSVITTKVANMPAMQGISLSKADVYWERYYSKKTDESYYDYYILYPFSQKEIDEFIELYEAQEQALYDKINKYRDALGNIDDINVLMENINEMKSMIKELGEDDPKSNMLKNNIALYENVISNIYIEVLENKSGRLLIQLKHDDKVMKTQTLPQMKGDCARDFNKRHVGNRIEISFNTFDCYEQDDNYVEIKFTFGKKKITEKISINI
ncbi:MAG: hypothetical protein IKW51_10005 [Bacteroidales bacterium]|nr:hypothetical protein [Bacteroidales bacterium]